MHPKLKDGRAAIYARYSSDRQRETSIEDQVRRCREYIGQAGGDPEAAAVFADYAVSGASLQRPGFEQLMAAIDNDKIDVVVTEDLSRISRDFADSALIFKQLQFAEIPLLGIADGIDTSSRHAKLSFTVKSLVADLYLDDLRDKTLRGLEGRALAGYATGGVPYGYRTVPDMRGEELLGHKIEINEKQARLIVRVFNEYRDGGSYSSIARKLNREGVDSPRAKTKHKRSGWGPSTIRAILYNEKYIGVWKFKETQWVKVPGTNKRRARARDASEVMTFERPELRIVDQDLWDEVRALLGVSAGKGGGQKQRGRKGRRSTYLLSGILVCDECGAPLTIVGSNSYYRCSDNRNKGTCPNNRSFLEKEARAKILGMLQASLTAPDGIAFLRKEIAGQLRDYSNTIQVELKERRDRLSRTEDKIAGLVGFIAGGDTSRYVVDSLHDLEAHAKAEKRDIGRLLEDAKKPLRLPSIDEIRESVVNFEARFAQDVDAGRAQLKRWLKDETIRIAWTEDGQWYPKGALLPLAIFAENEKHLGPFGAEVSTRCSGGRI